jgi:hypothetical protein
MAAAPMAWHIAMLLSLATYRSSPEVPHARPALALLLGLPGIQEYDPCSVLAYLVSAYGGAVIVRSGPAIPIWKCHSIVMPTTHWGMAKHLPDSTCFIHSFLAQTSVPRPACRRPLLGTAVASKPSFPKGAERMQQPECSCRPPGTPGAGCRPICRAPPATSASLRALKATNPPSCMPTTTAQPSGPLSPHGQPAVQPLRTPLLQARGSNPTSFQVHAGFSAGVQQGQLQGQQQRTPPELLLRTSRATWQQWQRHTCSSSGARERKEQCCEWHQAGQGLGKRWDLGPQGGQAGQWKWLWAYGRRWKSRGCGWGGRRGGQG